MDKNDHLKNLSIMHSMLTFVISMLLVFRTNSAYDRWWEGRKLWGALVNNSRNLSLKLNSILPAGDTENRSFFSVMIPNYAFALKSHLRNSFHPNELQHHPYFDHNGLRPDKHQPNFLARLIYNRVHELNRQGVISNEHLIYLNPELISFTDICGACERIKNTPIPFSYGIFLKKFIFFFVMTLPFTMVFSLGYYCIPVVAFIFYALTSMELIAEEIEDPFGHDENDLPTEAISKNIRKAVHEIFELGHS
jgi:putative membrane protein